MRRSLLLLALLLVPVAAVGLAQQPPIPPPPPRTLPPSVVGGQPPAGPVTPAAHHATEAPLAKLEPLAAFPAPTQFAVRSVLLGSAWLTRRSEPHGRFTYGYLPALRQPMKGDHDLRQALAALALAEAARFAGDDRQAAVASQAVLTLLAATRIDPADPNGRVPHPLGCNEVGFAAVLALAIYELPGADERLIAEAERLCHFLRRQCRPDGSVDDGQGVRNATASVQRANYADGGDGAKPTLLAANGEWENPGFALHALAVSSRVRPDPWKLKAVAKGLEHYRAKFKADMQPMFAATLTPAFAELALQTKSAAAAAVVFEMCDHLADLHLQTGDPRFPAWTGGFMAWADGKRHTQPGPVYEGAAYVRGLCDAYRLARLTADQAREARYKQVIVDEVQFLTGFQYLEANTRHFENAFRANVLIGGFYLSPTDGNLRIDATAWGVCGMVRFLTCGAER